MTVPSAGAESPDSCPNCGTRLRGDFCHDCGQRLTPARITVRGTLRALVLDAFDLDRGLVHTALELTVRPGHLVRHFIAGQRVRFTNPVKYFLITATIAQIVSWWLGVTLSAAEGFAAGYVETRTTSDGPLTGEATGAFLDRYFVILIAASVPLFAAATRMVFARERLTFAEHLVLNLYLTGQLNLAFATLILVNSPLPETVQMVGHAAFFLLLPAYYGIATAQLFARPMLDSLFRVTLASAIAAALSLLLTGSFLAITS